MNTEISYLYRDASNYKFRGSLIVEGSFSVSMVEEYLIDGEFFVPAGIGIPALTPEIRNEDDHDWHTFEECESTQAGPALMTAEQLLERVRRAATRGW